MAGEKRVSVRRPILETFSMFAVIPRKGGIRNHIIDLSERGLGFAISSETDAEAGFPIEEGESLDLHVYLNQTLFVPVSGKVVRLSKADGELTVGLEFLEKSKGRSAIEAFVRFLDSVVDLGVPRAKRSKA